MKRLISLLTVAAMCLALLSAFAFSAFAAVGTINISRVNSYNSSSDIVLWASTAQNATVQSIYGSPTDITFNYWYFILLEYNSTSKSYRVVDTSGFDAYGNSTRPDETYTSWTLGSNRIAIMAKTQATDTDGLNLLKSSAINDTIYLNKTVASLANMYGAVTNVYGSTQYVEIEEDTIPEVSEPEISVPDESSEPEVSTPDDSSEPEYEPEYESVLDINLTGPSSYRPGDKITVTATVDNVTARNGVSLVQFLLKYDRNQLTLTNDIIESNYNELDCIANIPDANRWENLSYVDCTVDEATSVATPQNDGLINVQLLTTYYDPEYFADEDGEIELYFNFTVNDNAIGDLAFEIDEESVVVGVNSLEGVDVYTGTPYSLTVYEDITKFSVDFEAPDTYYPGKDITVTATINNVLGNGVSLIQFPIDYDSSMLTLKNSVDADNYNALDCIVSLPNTSWENMTYDKNGTIYVQLLTTETDASYFAKEDGSIELTFTFTTNEEMSGDIEIGVNDDDIIGAMNTVDGVNEFVGSGSYVTIKEGETSFDITLDAPDSYKAGEEITVTATVNNIKSGVGISLVQFVLDYDHDNLVLTNALDEANYNALDCVTSLPNSTWENLSFVDKGVITVQLLTAETNSVNFAKEDGEITLTFTFTVKAEAESDVAISISDENILGLANTSNSYKTVTGYGDSVVVKPNTASYLLGDINFDGIVNTSDYTVVRRAVMGTYTLSAEQVLVADVDGNGTVSTADYSAIKRAVMGTYTLN